MGLKCTWAVSERGSENSVDREWSAEFQSAGTEQGHRNKHER